MQILMKTLTLNDRACESVECEEIWAATSITHSLQIHFFYVHYTILGHETTGMAAELFRPLPPSMKSRESLGTYAEQTLMPSVFQMSAAESAWNSN